MCNICLTAGGSCAPAISVALVGGLAAVEPCLQPFSRTSSLLGAIFQKPGRLCPRLFGRSTPEEWPRIVIPSGSIHTLRSFCLRNTTVDGSLPDGSVVTRRSPPSLCDLTLLGSFRTNLCSLGTAFCESAIKPAFFLSRYFAALEPQAKTLAAVVHCSCAARPVIASGFSIRPSQSAWVTGGVASLRPTKSPLAATTCIHPLCSLLHSLLPSSFFIPGLGLRYFVSIGSISFSSYLRVPRPRPLTWLVFARFGSPLHLPSEASTPLLALAPTSPTFHLRRV